MPTFRSSAVKRGEYDPRSLRMDLWLAGGGRYSYCGVPPHIWEGLCDAPSKGRYFNLHIDGRFQC